MTFHGELRREQQIAATAMLAHDTGVLAATTAFGKTVIAAWLRRNRQVKQDLREGLWQARRERLQFTSRNDDGHASVLADTQHDVLPRGEQDVGVPVAEPRRRAHFLNAGRLNAQFHEQLAGASEYDHGAAI